MKDPDFVELQKLVLEGSGVVLNDGKEYLAKARLIPLIRAEGIESLAELFSVLRQSPCGTLAEKVVDAMLTKETSFFRDLRLFETLRQDLLPRVIERRLPEQRLAIWSAACALGQEPYSIAMLIREHFPELQDWQLEFVASDISSASLERARAGSYTQFEINRGLSASLLPKYFTQAESAWLVREEIRDMVQFRRMNLIEGWPGLPKMDVIFLRNVLIYFDEPMREQILRRIHKQLRPNAYLFLGGSETLLSLTDIGYEAVGPSGVYRARGAAGTEP